MAKDGYAPRSRLARFFSSVGFILVFALVVRCGISYLSFNALHADPDNYRGLAKNVAQHGTFGHGSLPTAYRPPLYPLTLAPLVAWGDPAIAALHVALGVATVGLVLLLGRWWGLGRGGSALAAALVACDPILLSQSTVVMTETLATFLAVAALVALTWADRRPSMTRLFMAGAVLSLGALCRPTFLLFALAALAVWTWRFASTLWRENKDSQAVSGRAKVDLRLLWAFTFAMALVLAPWAIRNQIELGRPIVTTTHGGYTLRLGNNPDFYKWLREGQWGSVWEPTVPLSVSFSDSWPDPEIQSDEQQYVWAKQAIRDEPGMFCYACLVRIGRFWSLLPHCVVENESFLRALSRWLVAAWYVAEFAFAVMGIYCLRRCGESTSHEPSSENSRGRCWFWGFALVLCTMAPHVVYWTDMRMRAPIMPIVALAAAVGVAFVIARRTARIGWPR